MEILDSVIFGNGKLLSYYFCQRRSASQLANSTGKLIAGKSLIFLKYVVINWASTKPEFHFGVDVEVVEGT